MGGKNNQVGEIGKVGPIRKKDLRVVERGKTDPLANKSTPKKWIGNKNGRGRPKKAEEEEAKQNKLAKLRRHASRVHFAKIHLE